MTQAARIDWRHVIERAAEIVRSYDTSVTLRQLFYRLVSSQEIPNTESRTSVCPGSLRRLAVTGRSPT